MLSFLFLRYLSFNFEEAAKKELGRDYPDLTTTDKRTALSIWYSCLHFGFEEMQKTR
jgi:type I restriction enzyme M protein